MHEDFVSGKSQVHVQRKAFSFWGNSPQTSDQGLCSWTPLGAQPPDP